jgi:hypothetical protein
LAKVVALKNSKFPKLNWSVSQAGKFGSKNAADVAGLLVVHHVLPKSLPSLD